MIECYGRFAIQSIFIILISVCSDDLIDRSKSFSDQIVLIYRLLVFLYDIIHHTIILQDCTSYFSFVQVIQ